MCWEVFYLPDETLRTFRWMGIQWIWQASLLRDRP